MDQGSGVQNLVTDREKEYLAKLCWLLHDAGTYALRSTFNSIHPAISLKDHLAQVHIQSVLAKLYQQKAISEKQWKVLYPPGKGAVSSQYYDSRLLVILLQTICHLSPPYPNGWATVPLAMDTSLSADVVRLQIFLQQIGSLVGVRHEEYPVLWRQVVGVLLRHGGATVRSKIHRTDTEQLSLEQQNYYIHQVKEIWGTIESDVGAMRHLNGPRALNKPSKGSRNKKSTEEHEGLSLEDKVVLAKMFKLLVDNVVAEDIIDRLQQGQIIKITDRQEIMALSRNSDRMQYILAKIQNSKLPYALKLLCDALKFKYTKIYDEVTELRRITYKHGVKETKDMIGLCNTALKAHYNNVLTKCCPLPWIENIKLPINEYYTKLDILNSDGHKVRLADILPERVSGRAGKRVILEGEAGSGKSMLASMLAYKWASKPAFFSQYYRFLILVDAQGCSGDFREYVYHQTMPNHSKVTCDEFWVTLEEHAKDAVFLIDGFTGGSSELTRIMDGTICRDSSVIVLVNPNTSMSRFFKPDYKLFNVGLSAKSVSRCLLGYAGIVHIGADDYESLLEDLESWRLGMQMCNPFICMAIIISYKYANLEIKKVENLTTLFELYVKGLVVQFCKRQHVVLEKGEYPQEVGDIVHLTEELCFNMLTSKKAYLTEGELVGHTQNINIMKLGIFQKSVISGLIKGHCSSICSYMAARYLADMLLDDLHDTLDQRNLLKYTKYSDMVSFLNGIYATDPITTTLETIITEMMRVSNRHCRVVSIEDSSEVKEQIYSSNLVTFSQSLHSLSECNNSYITRLVAESFPKSLTLHKRGLYPINCLRGLARILESGHCHLVNFDMAMHPFYLGQQSTYLELASALSSCTTLKIIKATWTRLDMVARFLAIATQNKPQLDLVHIDFHGKPVSEEISAVTWDDLQTFCENLSNTTKFVFRRCTIASIAGHVINCLPKSIQVLDFSHTTLNLISATDLASYLEHSLSLKSLNLTETGLEGSAIVALAHGLKLSSSIETLRLCGIQFDRPGIFALGQSLRLVTTLKRLDIGGCDLSTNMCAILSSALEENHSMKTLVVSTSQVTEEGKLMMHEGGTGDLSVVISDYKADAISV
ncbi:uncharacterized protein LOC126823646 [Patella vulgata]|uniref:uncharacterized protein LOC126823646 n=1 Tax=Patella vulgata TaxID=6465 RepID=UPI0024A8CB4C|nr:uncharacterized protein LOC126823646 [Patella vulgata]XP_050408562.2 uncharacterized protein LOC126823646 [Patella vulgata]